MQPKKAEKLYSVLGLILCLLLVLAAVFFVASNTSADFSAHCVSDSYTLQALAWRDGRTSLGRDYPWLELAVYNNDWYVSFAPFPTVPMLILSFFFGENTPNALMCLLYFLCGVSACYVFLRRRFGALCAAGVSSFVCAGSCLLDVVVSEASFCGAVWYQAQLLSFALTMSAFALLDTQEEHPFAWAFGLICIALSVACRPFSAVYVPFFLWQTWLHLGKPGIKTVFFRMLPYIAVPALIAAALGWYNVIRFGNPFEFGTSYLPEFVNAQEPIFSFSRIGRNILNCLRLPSISGGSLYLPVISGFALYLVIPVFDIAVIRSAERICQKQITAHSLFLAVSLVLHMLLLLTHRTNGGWQYGTRYLCDCIPALIVFCSMGSKKPRCTEAALVGMLTMFNLLGIIVFHA